MKSGFVNIFGRPNAGKSTLLNALMGEKLAIVSPKVQTTRHRIKGILTEKDYQIIFSDTPGIIEPRYKLHEKMMLAVKSALEDADLAMLMVDVKEKWDECDQIFSALQLRVPAIVVINKIDLASEEKIKEAKASKEELKSLQDKFDVLYDLYEEEKENNEEAIKNKAKENNKENSIAEFANAARNGSIRSHPYRRCGQRPLPSGPNRQ